MDPHEAREILREERRAERAAALAALNGWIAVADRLPERGAEVLAYCKTGIIGERMQRVACHHPTDGWRTKGGLHLTVTHWMTLPEGPRDA